MRPFLALPVVHFMVTRWGIARMKRAAFDAKWRSGIWNFSVESPELVRLVASRGIGGSIAVLGCGSNTLGRALPPGSYSTLHGFDLSTEAIGRAKQGAPAGQYFAQLDMTAYSPPVNYFDLIILPESLYYLSVSDALILLKRVARGLIKDGLFITTFAQPKRYAQYLAMIRTNFCVLDDRKLDPATERHVISFAADSPDTVVEVREVETDETKRVRRKLNGLGRNICESRAAPQRRDGAVQVGEDYELQSQTPSLSHGISPNASAQGMTGESKQNGG